MWRVRWAWNGVICTRSASSWELICSRCASLNKFRNGREKNHSELLPCENGAVNPWLIGAPAIAAAAAGAVAYAGTDPSAQPFGPTAFRTHSPRKLALTIHHGPNPPMIPQLVDL